MGSTSTIFYILNFLPEFLVWVWGIAWAVSTWQRHPRRSLFTCIGLGIFLVSAPIFMSAYALVPRLSSSGMSSWKIDGLIRVVGFLHSILGAGAWVLVLLALFGKEKLPSPAAGAPPAPREEPLP